MLMVNRNKYMNTKMKIHRKTNLIIIVHYFSTGEDNYFNPTMGNMKGEKLHFLLTCI